MLGPVRKFVGRTTTATQYDGFGAGGAEVGFGPGVGKGDPPTGPVMNAAEAASEDGGAAWVTEGMLNMLSTVAAARKDEITNLRTETAIKISLKT